MSGHDAIIRKSDLEPKRNVEGHAGITIYRFARPGTNSRWLHLTLNEIEEGGAIEPHYHVGVEFDHAYYVIEGEVIARVGDHEERIGPDSLMLFPCQTVHGFRVVSPGGAKILRLGASDTGVSSGGNVHVT
jgi:mannose-6-phosphate isomerase-like protein (cupin superfamily)